MHFLILVNDYYTIRLTTPEDSHVVFSPFYPNDVNLVRKWKFEIEIFSPMGSFVELTFLDFNMPNGRYLVVCNGKFYSVKIYFLMSPILLHVSLI